MSCCRKVKQIAIGYFGYVVKKTTGIEILKSPYTDTRIRICQRCERNHWICKTLWCQECKCFVPAAARVEEKHCPIKKW